MKHFLFVIFTIVGILANIGCADIGRINKDRQTIPFRAYPESDKAAIYLWPPYTSAAIVDPKNNRCILTASGAQTFDASSEAALKVGDVFGKIADLDASKKSQLVEAFKQISQPDNRSTSLDIALFHLCILDQNGTFDDMHTPGSKGPLILDAYMKTVEKVLAIPK